MSSTSRSLTVLKKTLQHARAEMHRHSIFHHDQSSAGLSVVLGVLQGCEALSEAFPCPFLVPVLKGAVKITKSIQTVNSNRDSCTDFIKKTSDYLDALQEYDSHFSHDPISELVQKHRQEFVRSLKELRERSNELTSHGKLHNVLHSSENKASLEKINRELETATTLHFFQLSEELLKELETLHEEHNSQQDSSPYSHTIKKPQAYTGPKLAPNELFTSCYTEPAHDTHSGDYMCMPVPDIGGPVYNYTHEYIQMPTPEPYYPHLSQPQPYYVLS